MCVYIRVLIFIHCRISLERYLILKINTKNWYLKG